MYILKNFLKKWFLVFLIIISVASMTFCIYIVFDGAEKALSEFELRRFFSVYPTDNNFEKTRGFVNEIAGRSDLNRYDIIAVLAPDKSQNFYTYPDINWMGVRNYVYGVSNSLGLYRDGEYISPIGRDLDAYDIESRLRVAHLYIGEIDANEVERGTATVNIDGTEFTVIGGTGVLGGQLCYIPLSTFFDMEYDVEYVAIEYSGADGKGIRGEIKKLCKEHYGVEGYTLKTGLRDVSEGITVVCMSFGLGILIILGLGLFNLLALMSFLRASLSSVCYAFRVCGGSKHILGVAMLCGVLITLIIGTIIGTAVAYMLRVEVFDIYSFCVGAIVPCILGAGLSLYVLVRNIGNSDIKVL